MFCIYVHLCMHFTGGYLYVEDILKRQKYKGTLEDVQRIVANNDKQRFALTTDENGKHMIRANQGHSIQELTVRTHAR